MWHGEESSGLLGLMMKTIRFLTCSLALVVLGVAATAEAATNGIPWRVGAYTLTARAMPVQQALETFAVAQGMPIILSKGMAKSGGTVSGTFKDVPPVEFLDKVTTINNLIWYHDGATLYVYGASEAVSTLIDLKYMKADELGALLKEFGVEDPRYPIKEGKNGEIIMVSGPPRYVQLVAELIARADNLREQRTFNETEVRLFPLLFTWADTVSISISTPESTAQLKGIAQILQEMTAQNVAEMALEGTNSLDRAGAAQNRLSQRVKPIISPENRLNAVLIRDSVTRMPMYEKLIKQLDRPVKLVEVAITTVELSKNDSLDWQASLTVTGGAEKHDGTENHTGGAGMNADNLMTPDALAGKGLSGAYSFVGDNVTVGASLSALKSKGKTRGISRTAILTLNNFAASISDTQTYNARVVGTEVANLQSVSAGTSFNLKPRAVKTQETNELHDVWMTLKIQDGGFESEKVDGMPMSRTTTLTLLSMVREGQSLVVAGYMRDVEGEAGWGIPYLRDIPFIGWLFGGSSKSKETVQRMFVLTPRVIECTPDTPGIQTRRLRDTTEPEVLSEVVEREDRARRLREQAVSNQRMIEIEQNDAEFKRREAENARDERIRKLERRKEDDELRKVRRTWEKEYKELEEAYRESQKSK